MSDFNNYPNGGYPQQPMQNGYPQQPQQMGGYQQPMQNGYQQPQQMQPGMGMQAGMMPGMGMQQMGGYPQQGPSQPPKKKSNAGLIIGIIVAILAIAGLVVFLLRDKIFGEKLSGGYESPEKAVTVFFEAFSATDRAKMESCFVTSSSTYKTDVDNNIAQAEKIGSYTTIHTNDIKVTTSDYSDKDGLKSRGYKKLKDAKSFHAEVPMTQTIDGITYEVLDIYDGCAVKMNNDKWYLVDMQETDAQIVDTDFGFDIDEDTEEDIIDDTEEDIDWDLTTEAASVPDGFKTMGDAVNGYVDVPGNWVNFYEEGGISGTYSNVQFSTLDQAAIVTLCTYESDAEASAVAESMKETLEEEASDVQLNYSVMGGYTASEIRCYYPDEDVTLAMWIFRAPDFDNLLHYVAVEYTPDNADAEVYVDSSFRLE